MKEIIVSQEVIKLSDEIATKSAREANCHPVDRYFLESYIPAIFNLNKNEFFLCNFERVNNTYTIQLMLCLPELWQETTRKDIENIIFNFSNIHSYYAIVMFVYKYIEVDIFSFILQLDFVPESEKESIISYISHQYPNLYKDNGDYIFFGENEDNENLYGVTLEQWRQVKHHFLNEGFSPAMKVSKLKEYLLEINP